MNTFWCGAAVKAKSCTGRGGRFDPLIRSELRGLASGGNLRGSNTLMAKRLASDFPATIPRSSSPHLVGGGPVTVVAPTNPTSLFRFSWPVFRISRSAFWRRWGNWRDRVLDPDGQCGEWPRPRRRTGNRGVLRRRIDAVTRGSASTGLLGLAVETGFDDQH